LAQSGSHHKGNAAKVRGVSIKKEVLILGENPEVPFERKSVILRAVGREGYVLTSIVDSDEEISMDLPLLHGGFFDSHLHLCWMGEFSQRIIGDHFINAQDYLDALVQKADHFTGTLISYAFDESRWGLSLKDFYQECSQKLEQDKVWILFRRCAHRAIVSDAALEKFLPGKGFTNILDDKGIVALQDALPPASLQSRRTQFLVAQEKLLQLGINAVGDMSLDRPTYECIRSLAKSGELLLDYQGVLLDDEETRELDPFSEDFQCPMGTRRVEIKHWKRYLDGSFGSQTAHLLDPYTTEEGTIGLKLWENDELFSEAKRALSRGFALSFHAIGDAAFEQILELSEALSSELKASVAAAGCRIHRIEHGQLVKKEQIERLQKDFPYWNIAVQPEHEIEDRSFSKKYLGEDRAYNDAYRLKSFIDAKIPISLGSDAPVVSCDPMRTLRASAVELRESERISYWKALQLFLNEGRDTHSLPRRPVGIGERVFLFEGWQK